MCGEARVSCRRPGVLPSAWSVFLLLCALLLVYAGPARADSCPSGVLPRQGIRLGGGHAKRQQPDLVISTTCVVNQPGTYDYGQVNIVGGGTLEFDEPATPNTTVDFWASSIVVEANGALKVGSQTAPYGKNGGFLTIYLYGADRSGGKDPASNPGQGVLCKSATSATTGPCGIPLAVWNDNGKDLLPGCGADTGPGSTPCIPGLATTASDYFYQYGPLYGDGLCTNGSTFKPVDGKAMCGTDPADGLVGYFGYKVLAVSYGGTLQMFGYLGADYDPTVDGNPLNSGVSWARLSGDVLRGGTSLTLDAANAIGDKWWRAGQPASIPSQIVVTTTDYLPTHSEPLTITSTKGQTVDFAPAIAWFHRGTRFPLKNRFDGATVPPGAVTARLEKAGMDSDLIASGAETRAAVALLTRSIRIVSAGDTIGQKFSDMPSNYYFGGHTIFRQGFRQVQVQGVEFDDLGQGGKLGHYPIHFHMARLVPSDTFVKDSSVDVSMTRWYVLHSTQGVTLARNVGWKSIGHGYYLESGTETDNKLYSNIGILARAAIANDQNSRGVPGILADNQDPSDFKGSDVANPGFPYRSDNEYPTVFWITNGWNDFEGNMAAGAEACGAGYWLVPAMNNDAPDVPTADNVFNHVNPNDPHMKWDYDAAGDFGYAGLQTERNAASDSTYGGATPLETFTHNYATSSMLSFQTTPDAPSCTDRDLGFVPADNQNPPNFPIIREIHSFAPKPVRHLVVDHTEPDPLDDPYFPHVIGARKATICPAGKTIAGRPPVHVCNTVPNCDPGSESACGVTVLDHYTSAFNWAFGAISAVWLRPQWYLLDNSVLSDVQNGALTFVTGGDFTHSSVIPGHWAVALDSIFIGHTQPQDAAHAFALDSGPFNGLSHEKCDLQSGQATPSYCLNKEDGISMPTSGFFINQRMMNIYDGPAYQDSNAYLDVTTSSCPAPEAYNAGCIYGSGLAYVPKDPSTATPSCYLPNAAIAWKQPNGFFYPPAFHSTNLFFDDVEIRHYVIDPLFQAPGSVTGTTWDFGQGGTYITDAKLTTADYCVSTSNLFNSFTSIDRQTELNDDDGTLTGLSNNVTAPSPLKQTISVNDDEFFTAPLETPQCQSNIGTNSTPARVCQTPSTTEAPVTAKTSPYDYVATVIWHPPAGGIWDPDCTSAGCYGVPLFRQFLTGTNGGNEASSTREWKQWYHNGCDSDTGRDTPQCRWPFIRMSGEGISTRETLTLDNGTYYLDTTVPKSMQASEDYNQVGGTTSFNVFQPNQTYTVFFIYAKPSTEQTYQIYVGDTDPNITAVRVPIPDAQFSPTKVTPTPSWLSSRYDPTTGIVSVTVDFSAVTDLDPASDPDLCQPHSFCTRGTGGACVSLLSQSDPLKTVYDRACGWAVKDLDCPSANGCYGFQFTLGSDFNPDATSANPSPHRPGPNPFPTTVGKRKRDLLVQFLNTNVAPDSAAKTSGYTGPSCYYPTLPTQACLGKTRH